MTSQLVSHLTMNRRELLRGSLAWGTTAGMVGALAPAAAPAASGGLDYEGPADNLYAFGKIWAGYDEPVIGGFHGLMYVRMGSKRMGPARRRQEGRLGSRGRAARRSTVARSLAPETRRW